MWERWVEWGGKTGPKKSKVLEKGESKSIIFRLHPRTKKQTHGVRNHPSLHTRPKRRIQQPAASYDRSEA